MQINETYYKTYNLQLFNTQTNYLLFIVTSLARKHNTMTKNSI